MSNADAERVGVLDAKVTAAHSRLDRLETGVRDDLKEIKKDLKELNGHMNRGKGWAAAALMIASAVGAGVMKLLTVFLGG